MADLVQNLAIGGLIGLGIALVIVWGHQRLRR